MPRSIPFCVFFLLLAPAAPAAAPPPTLVADGDSQAGNLTLSWSLPEGVSGSTVEVQQARSAEFAASRDVYRGPHGSSVVSGLRDGTFHFRARYQLGEQWSEWSAPVRFEVEHPPLSSALGLFALGALVFGSTAWVILRGPREGAPDRGEA